MGSPAESDCTTPADNTDELWQKRHTTAREIARLFLYTSTPHLVPYPFPTMPISPNTPSSYVPTIIAFLDHWQDVNTALGVAGPLILRKETLGTAADVTRAVLETQLTTLQAQQATVQAALVDLDLARGEFDDQKTALLAKANMFNEKVRAVLGNTRWERSLSDIPSPTAGLGAFTDPMQGTLTLWQRINTTGVLGGADLVLRDGTDADAFETLLTAFQTAYRATSRAEKTLKLEREERNDMQDTIYPILKQYRVAVNGSFAADSAIVESLPRLTPEPGHTPDPVNASIVWDAAAQMAKITWSASTDAALKRFEVRYSPGTSFHADEEQTLGSIAPDAPREFLTDHALHDPGDRAFFRVYVILDTDNESGSNDVDVTRP